MSKFEISLNDKPNLAKLLRNDPDFGRQVVKAFVGMIEYSIENKWTELPKEFHDDLTFIDLIQGILKGSLDLKQINSETYDILKAEIHPLSLMQTKFNYLDNEPQYYEWRKHFGLPKNADVSAETIADIFRKLLRYSRYVNIETLQKSLMYNQIATYRGLGDEQVKKLPFYPALRYQEQTFGELHVGKYLDEVGFLDCGTTDGQQCLACQRKLTEMDNYKLCLGCNAGYKK